MLQVSSDTCLEFKRISFIKNSKNAGIPFAAFYITAEVAKIQFINIFHVSDNRFFTELKNTECAHTLYLFLSFEKASNLQDFLPPSKTVLHKSTDTTPWYETGDYPNLEKLN